MVKYKVPFNSRGLMHSDRWTSATSINWEDPKPFKARLRIQSLVRGKSAAYFEFIDEVSGKIYPMFLKDIMNSIKYFSEGYIAGTFIPVKRGRNYGIKLLGVDR